MLVNMINITQKLITIKVHYISRTIALRGTGAFILTSYKGIVAVLLFVLASVSIARGIN